jgi:hypothetical protein
MYRICPVCFLNINTCAYVVNVLTLTLNTQDKRTDNRFVKNRYNDENDGETYSIGLIRFMYEVQLCSGGPTDVIIEGDWYVPVH